MMRFSAATLSLSLMLASAASIFARDSQGNDQLVIKSPLIVDVKDLLIGLGINSPLPESDVDFVDDETLSRHLQEETPRRVLMPEIEGKRFNLSFPSKSLHDMTAEDWDEFAGVVAGYRQERNALALECEESIQDAATYATHKKIIKTRQLVDKRWVEKNQLQETKKFDRNKLEKSLRLAFQRLYAYTQKIDEILCAIPTRLLGEEGGSSLYPD